MKTNPELFTKGLLVFSLLFLLSLAHETELDKQEIIVDGSWGFFKPHLLMCLTQRSLNPLNFGLIYSNYRNSNIRNHLRWGFGNSMNGINAYYSAHNGKDYTEHTIIDKQQNIRIEYTYIYDKDQDAWKMKMKIDNLDAQQSSVQNIFLYLTSSSFEENKHLSQHVLQFEKAEEQSLSRISITDSVRNSSEQKIKQLRISEESIFKDAEPTLIEGTLNTVSASQAWDMQRMLMQSINYDGNFSDEVIYRSDNLDYENSDNFISLNNVALIRVSNPWRSSITLLIDYGPQEESQDVEFAPFNCQDNANCFNEIVAQRSAQFTNEIRSRFGSYQFDFIQNVLSNLLGGFVFYHGKIVTKNSLIQSNPLKTVFSASPSRKIFPRAFLWDEGFHLSIICIWSEILCRNSLSSWMSLQDVLGYIPREQVRTPEISQYVPDGFRSQDANEANPPTLLFPFLMLLKTNSIQNHAFIEKQLRPLEKWFKWMRTTQSHYDNQRDNSIKESLISQSFRWKCKNGECKQGNFLGSGLDDYPRQDAGTQLQQHLDLQTWMIFFADSLEKIFSLFSPVKAKQYAEIKQRYTEQLLEEFVDQTDGLFKDIVTKGKRDLHLTHDGYITLFPLFFNSVSVNSKEFEAILDLLSDPNRLWSDFGIRSLSVQDEYYGQGDNYWRGPIWMPLNYLILRSLKLHYFDDERVRIIYSSLRENLIRNMERNWQNSGGYIFETYNPKTGQGQRAFPFNGWSALIILVISEQY